MEKIKKGLYKKNMYKILFLLAAIIILFSSYFILNVDFDVIFNNPCVVESYSDIEQCTDKYTIINYEKIYDTEIYFNVDSTEKGNFVDIDLDGYILIGLVQREEAVALFGKTEARTLTGKLEVFTGDKEGIIDNVIDTYMDSFGTALTEDELRSVVIDVQFNAYGDSIRNEFVLFYSISAILLLLLLLLIIVVFRRMGIKALYQKDVKKESVLNELEIGPYLFKGKRFILTFNYFVAIGHRIKVFKLDDLEWTYERIVTNVGSSKKSKYLIFVFKNKQKVKIKFTIEDSENIIRLLTLRNENMKTGFEKKKSK